jgi:hypothetical protein
LGKTDLHHPFRFGEYPNHHKLPHHPPALSCRNKISISYYSLLATHKITRLNQSSNYNRSMYWSAVNLLEKNTPWQTNSKILLLLRPAL